MREMPRVNSMLPKHTYLYTCTRTGRTKQDIIENIQDKRFYTECMRIVDYAKNLFFYIPDEEIENITDMIENNMVFNPEQVLQFDVMTSSRENMHYKLDKIIEQSQKGDTVLFLSSLGALGNIASIKKYYKIFRDKRIGVLIVDYTREDGLSEYSTHGFDFMPRSLDKYNRAFDLVIERLESGDIRDNRGCIAGDFTRNFRVAFWLYELFKIPESMAVQMNCSSKNGFHMQADRYEQTQNYMEELKRMESEFQISNLIKRNRPVPENMEEIIKQYRKKGSLELACILTKTPMIFPIDYVRLIRKQEGGKKELRKCLQLYDTELIHRFEQWIDSGKPADEFYTQCDMEKYLFNTGMIF
ncbi:MAG: hypothetical protein IKL28_06475 [Lachnospiraceae bacterium]|nr:hypothetical protein [Lachnospiraceae bacterium]